MFFFFFQAEDGIRDAQESRGLGIGTGLMKTMLTHLKEIGFSRVSLCVQKANYAAGLYLRLGFQIVAEHAEEYLMVCEL